MSFRSPLHSDKQIISFYRISYFFEYSKKNTFSQTPMLKLNSESLKTVRMV